MTVRAILAAALMLAAAPALAAPAPAAVAAQALASPTRPAEDRAQDQRRKAAEIIAFAGIKAGDKVADVYPGGGYFSRAFAAAVGPTGKVYGIVSKADKDSAALTGNPAFSNIAVVVKPGFLVEAPEPLDLIFISQFYHDMYNSKYGPAGGIAAGNAAMFKALRPGGTLLIVDHAAPAGAGTTTIATTHRIEENAARRDITAAGFVYEGAIQVLRNPADDHSKNVFDPAIRGKTDQFVLKFKKPG